jgi:uncharacterized protein (TIGR03437 family)
VLVPVLGQAQAPPQYTIATIAGNCSSVPCQGNFAGDGGPATNAFLFGPSDVVFDSLGNLYFSDTVNNRIRQLNLGTPMLSTVIISTVAGNGTAGYFGDGSSATAQGTELYSPTGITFGGSGNFYIADTGNAVIREVMNIGSGGNISTVAGDNTLGAGFGGDGAPATGAQLSNPTGVVVDSSGNMYIADPDNNVVRVVCGNPAPSVCSTESLPAGDITTFAGNQPTGANYTGDGGLATQALLNDPVAVLLDSAGNLYISDSGNNAIRKVDTKGIITTVAGCCEANGSGGTAGYSGDGGPATKAELDNPKGLAFDSSGNLYIADRDNSVIRMVAPNGDIYTIAGNQHAGPGYSGDGGPATSAQLSSPAGVAAYGGKIYIADYGNNLIRVLTPPALAPQINAGGVVNGASYSSTEGVAPGSIADVFGTFYLTSASVNSDLPLDTSLQGLSFEFGGSTLAPLYFVSGGQANIQVPWELTGTSATLAATLNGTAGLAQTVKLAAFAPALFSMNSQGTGQGAILDTSYKLVDSSNPATAGTTYIQIYCTGLGAVSPQPATGSPAPSSAPFAETTTMPTVTIGGLAESTSAAVPFSGLAPGFVGLYQVDALVPAGVGSGNTVPVTITIGGVTSNTVTIAVQ